MLHILVHTALIQVIPGIGFNINTDRFHLSSNPKTGIGLCRRCPPSLLCIFFPLFTFPLFLLTPIMEFICNPDPKHGDNRDHIDCRASNDHLRIYHLVHSAHLDSQIVIGGRMYHLRLWFAVMTGNRHHPQSQNHPLPWTCRQEARRHGAFCRAYSFRSTAGAPMMRIKTRAFPLLQHLRFRHDRGVVSLVQIGKLVSLVRRKNLLHLCAMLIRFFAMPPIFSLQMLIPSAIFVMFAFVILWLLLPSLRGCLLIPPSTPAIRDTLG